MVLMEAQVAAAMVVEAAAMEGIVVAATQEEVTGRGSKPDSPGSHERSHT